MKSFAVRENDKINKKFLHPNFGFYKEKGVLDLQKHSQVLKNSQPSVGEGGSGEVRMVSQILRGFEFRSLPFVNSFDSGFDFVFLLVFVSGPSHSVTFIYNCMTYSLADTRLPRKSFKKILF